MYFSAASTGRRSNATPDRKGGGRLGLPQFEPPWFPTRRARDREPCVNPAGGLAQPRRAREGQFPWRPSGEPFREARARRENCSVGAAAFATIFTGLRVRQRGCERVGFVRKRRGESPDRALRLRFVCLLACPPYPPAGWGRARGRNVKGAGDVTHRGRKRSGRSGESIYSSPCILAPPALLRSRANRFAL